jgi:glutamate carboxypeptidase
MRLVMMHASSATNQIMRSFNSLMACLLDWHFVRLAFCVIRLRHVALSLFMAVATPCVVAQTPAQVHERAKAQTPALLDTLKDLVSIESGSRDLEGLEKVATLVAHPLQQVGMNVQIIPTRAPTSHPQLKGAKLGSVVYATKKGKGQKKVLLIAHMDTVYLKGMVAKQPFRIDGNKAYGLAIADDKAGVALILHTVKMLHDMGYEDYAELAVAINGDEEVGSAGSSHLLVKWGGEYDAVMSFEGGGLDQDLVRLATSSIAIVEMKVTGKASHAGANPDAGRNAIYEMSHQILKSRQFGDKSKGLFINWTVTRGGDVRNVIPASAEAIADVRSLTNQDLDSMESALHQSIKDKLIPDTQVEIEVYRSRPAFVATEASRVMAKHAQVAYQDIGQQLIVAERATGGGTDAAFAGLQPQGGVLEGFGLRGYGAHANTEEYIFIDSIAPRLYLSTRMVMDIGSGKIRW